MLSAASVGGRGGWSLIFKVGALIIFDCLPDVSTESEEVGFISAGVGDEYNYFEGSDSFFGRDAPILKN
eukprot:748338-Hanusia_phi.AAC.9